MGLELTERDLAEDVGGEALLSVVFLERLAPMGRGELEDSELGPLRDEAQEVAEVGVGLDAVHLAARDERDEGRVDLGRVVIADKQPVLATDRFAPQFALRAVVVDGQPTVVEEAEQGVFLGW